MQGLWLCQLYTALSNSLLFSLVVERSERIEFFLSRSPSSWSVHTHKKKHRDFLSPPRNWNFNFNAENRTTPNYGLLDLIVAESPVLETHVPPIPAAQNHVVFNSILDILPTGCGSLRWIKVNSSNISSRYVSLLDMTLTWLAVNDHRSSQAVLFRHFVTLTVSFISCYLDREGFNTFLDSVFVWNENNRENPLTRPAWIGLVNQLSLPQRKENTWDCFMVPLVFHS